MSKIEDKTIKITLSEDTHTELKIMAIRRRSALNEVISQALDKYVEKNKDKLVAVN